MGSENKTLLRRSAPLTAPVRVLQFGEGNFLRAFIDWMIERMNKKAGFNAAVQLVQPLAQGMGDLINAQDGLYTVILRGVENGQVVETMEKIECVKGCLNPATQWNEIEAAACNPDLRFVFSNTTEAGIEYRENADTFPFKVARLLTARAAKKLPGLVFIPCELIDKNGIMLRECALKYINDPGVRSYIENECVFCCTLVDRIVSGYPKDEAAKYGEKLGYEDKLLVCGEPFHFFVIEGPDSVRAELPFEKAGLNVLFTADQSPYRTRKVRFLNGAHTATALAGHLAGFTFVDEMVRDPKFNAILKAMLFDEILPTVQLPDAEKRAFAESILERFANPYAQHRLLSIALNSVSKWKVRVLPTILDYQKMFSKLPPNLTRSLASLIDFYRTCDIQDSPDIIEFFKNKPSVEDILKNKNFWDMDLTAIPGFADAVKKDVQS